MTRRIVLFLILAGIVPWISSCASPQTIIVEFADIKSDLFALEHGLHERAWDRRFPDQGNTAFHLQNSGRKML